MNRSKFLISLVSAFAVLSGCAGTHFFNPYIDPSDYQAVKAAIKSTYDPHKDRTTIRGPYAGFDPSLKNVYGGVIPAGGNYFLRSFLSSSKGYDDDSLVQIYVSAVFREWAFLEAAYSGGKRYPTTQIDRKVGSCSNGCTLHEDIAVNLTLGEIKKEILEKSSFVFKLSGKRESVVVKVPRVYFQAFVDRLENK